jgi:hypothetical protein
MAVPAHPLWLNRSSEEALDGSRNRARCDHAASPLFEAIIDDERRSNAFGLLMSLKVLIETRGGFNYTGADCAAWMREGGFTQTRVEHLSGPDPMVIGVNRK